jgi:hypothetical protein
MYLPPAESRQSDVVRYHPQENKKHCEQGGKDGVAADRDHPCPSTNEVFKEYGLDCPCSTQNLTSYVKKHLSVNFQFIPKSLLTTQWDEIKKIYGFKVVVKGKVVRDDEVPVTNDLKELVFVLAYGTAVSGRGWTDQKDALARAVHLKNPDGSCKYEKDKKGNIHPVLYPSYNNSRVVIVTTSGSCIKWALGRFKKIRRRNGRTPTSKEKQEWWLVHSACTYDRRTFLADSSGVCNEG